MPSASLTLTGAVLVALAARAAAVELPFGAGGASQAWYEQTYAVPYLTAARVRPIDFVVDAACFGLALLYLVVHRIGRARNRMLAQTWADLAAPMLRNEFAAVGKGKEIGAKGEETLVWNGGAEAVMYATGRRGVDSLHAAFRLKPLHDPLALLFHFVSDVIAAKGTSSIRDELILHFALPYQQPDNISGVFAVVAKDALRRTRAGRFDLTFAKLADDAEAKKRGLVERLSILSEASDLTDALLSEKVSAVEVLNGPAGHLLDSLVLSDQPQEKPEDGPQPVEKRRRMLVLTLKAPRNAAEARDSLALVEAACNIADAIELGTAKLREITVTKLRRTRADVDKQLQEEATKEQREEEEEARLNAKAKAAKDKLAGLSEKEQARRKEIERKRQMKKQGKTVKAR